MSAVVDVEIFN